MDREGKKNGRKSIGRERIREEGKGKEEEIRSEEYSIRYIIIVYV